MSWTIAQTATSVDSFSAWSNLTASAAIILLVLWLVTKGLPFLLDRHDKAQSESRAHFELILERIDERRFTSAKDGHDAASKLAESIDRQRAVLAENTEAIRNLTTTVRPH
jgi:flagellar biosynthesis/type III secretory pathway M-ring protein FliF/YscJ